VERKDPRQLSGKMGMTIRTEKGGYNSPSGSRPDGKKATCGRNAEMKGGMGLPKENCGLRIPTTTGYMVKKKYTLRRRNL